MANALEDRLKKIVNQTTITGIDFIHVSTDQKTLAVHFLRALPPLSSSPKTLLNTLKIKDIRIYNPSGEVPDIQIYDPSKKVPNVSPFNWAGDDVLKFTLEQSGDFTLYRIKFDNLPVDSFFNDVTFSFKANCPSDLDCAPAAHECPPEEPIDFPIDYLARDFWSFRTALLDFASLRYPDWTDRMEADAGIMMAEVMSALGDEMAYYQDRVSREAYLETATQRRSMRHLTRLVDYTVHDGLGATGWLDVQAKMAGDIPVGTDIWAIGDGGTRVNFEVGRGFNDPVPLSIYHVDPRNNEFQPHIWDKNQICLPVGTTEMYLEGHLKAHFNLTDYSTDPTKKDSKWVLLKTQPTNAAQPIRRQIVRLIDITETTDTLFNQPITHIVWDKEQALTFEFDLTVLVVRGNLVPISAGQTLTTFFMIGKKIDDLTDAAEIKLLNKNIEELNEALKPIGAGYDTSTAIEREGRVDTTRYLFTLPGSEQVPLVWLGDNPHKARPEIRLTEVKFNTADWAKVEQWHWKRSFIGVNSSESQDKHYVLEDGSWRRVVGYQRIGEEVVHRDYASNKGITVRFGDDEFGFTPTEGTIFQLAYRLGGGKQSNVAADTLTHFSETLGNIMGAVTNPLPTENGLDAELPNDIRQSAPEAFRAETYRAVRPEDYAEAAERLPWVQRAGAAFRWTGSWQTAFVTPDPFGAVTLEEPKRRELVNQLDRFRQAGREAYTLDPIYADLDLEIKICVKPDAYGGEVKARVWAVLIGKKGYFAPDKFTFGMPLERSTLETIIQNTEGVQAVEGIRFRRRGWFGWQKFNDFHYNPGKNAIIRVENDPLHPNRGSLNLKIHGGA